MISFCWSIDSCLRNGLFILTVSKAINCLIIHSLNLHTHRLTAMYLGKMMFSFIAMAAHGKTGISSHGFLSHVENYIHYNLLNIHKIGIF